LSGECAQFAVLTKDHVGQFAVGVLEIGNLRLKLFQTFLVHLRSLALPRGPGVAAHGARDGRGKIVDAAS
jgi:hypothetical protein